MTDDRVLWRAPGRGSNGSEGVTVYRPAKHVDGNRFGARVVEVRATEVDAKIFEGGVWRTLTFARSLAANAIADDPLVLTVSGDSISNYTVAAVAPAGFASAADAASSTGVGVVE